jgi:hypothetical protein
MHFIQAFKWKGPTQVQQKSKSTISNESTPTKVQQKNKATIPNATLQVL